LYLWRNFPTSVGALSDLKSFVKRRLLACFAIVIPRVYCRDRDSIQRTMHDEWSGYKVFGDVSCSFLRISGASHFWNCRPYQEALSIVLFHITLAVLSASFDAFQVGRERTPSRYGRIYNYLLSTMTYPIHISKLRHALKSSLRLIVSSKPRGLAVTKIKYFRRLGRDTSRL
jgi:hypothetical protein